MVPSFQATGCSTQCRPGSLAIRARECPGDGSVGRGRRRAIGYFPHIAEVSAGAASFGQEAVLHGEQRGRRPARDADFGVDVLDVVFGRLR
jgi:hypothetical protein